MTSAQRLCPFRGLARVEEGAFPGGQRLFGKILGGGQTRAPVEGVGITVQGFPDRGGLGEGAVQPQAVPVLVQPAAEAGPAADQGLVGDLDVVPVDGQQTCPGGLFEDQRGVTGVVEFLPRYTALGVLGALAQGDEPQEELSGDAPLGVAQV